MYDLISKTSNIGNWSQVSLGDQLNLNIEDRSELTSDTGEKFTSEIDPK